MKYLALAIVFFSLFSFGESYTDTYIETSHGVTTTRTITYFYSDNWVKLLKVKKCTTLVDNDNEEVISRVCKSVIK